MILLDTHVLVWLSQDASKLGRAAGSRLQVASKRGDLAVSTISYWEIAFLVGARRLRIPLGIEALRAAQLAAGIHEVPVDAEIAMLEHRTG